MALTRDFRETVAARVRNDPAFARALLDEAIALFVGGEPDAAKLVLRDLVNATLGFEALADAIGKPAKSVHRMLSTSGNPTMDNLSAVFAEVKAALESHAPEAARAATLPTAFEAGAAAHAHTARSVLVEATDRPLTKIDVARRQLVTAIRLLFEDGDSVSVLSLAANAWEVIDALCEQAGIQGVSHETRGHVPPGKDLKRDYINSPYRNFFKHADRDPEATLAGPSPSTIDSLVYLAVDDYLRLNGKGPVELQVFQLWYLATRIEKVADQAMVRVVRAVDAHLPGIRAMPRTEQVAAGKRLLARARGNTALLADARTEVHA